MFSVDKKLLLRWQKRARERTTEKKNIDYNNKDFIGKRTKKLTNFEFMTVVVTLLLLVFFSFIFVTLQNRITWPATMNAHMHWNVRLHLFVSRKSPFILCCTSLIFPAFLSFCPPLSDSPACVCVCVCFSFIIFHYLWDRHIPFFHWPISFSNLILYLPWNHFVYNWNVYVFLVHNDRQAAQ